MGPIARTINRIVRNRRGVSAVMTAVAAPALIGFAGLAIDVSLWQANQSQMQGAADQAAWAAALEYAAGGTTSYPVQARAMAAAHGFVQGTAGVTITVVVPPASGTHAGQANAAEVVISAPQTSYLSRMFLAAAPTETARAVVGSSGGNTCMETLDPNADTSLSITGSNTISLSNCDLYVNSPSAAAVVLTGTNHFSGRNLNLRGNYVSTGSTFTASGALKTGVGAAAPDPYASRVMPSTACTNAGQSSSTSMTFTALATPMVFCGNINATGTNQTLTFNPGVYIFNGASLNITGSWNVVGNGVTLIFTGSGASYGTMTVTGSTVLNLTAPTTGATKGMAIWVDKNSTVANLTFTGASQNNITGALYAPGTNVTIAGVSNSTCTQLIAYKLTLTGSSNLQHNCANAGVSDVGSTNLLE
jgi:Flp pilus assembly protein TadG